MTQFLTLTFFSLYLIGYGFVALFKKEWIWKIRHFSARIEGKPKAKDQANIDSMNRKGNILAILSLVFGLIMLLMNLYVFIVLRNPIEV